MEILHQTRSPPPGTLPCLLLSAPPRQELSPRPGKLSSRREEGYRTIRDLLLGVGYRQGSQPSIFLRDVPTGEASVIVDVHLLSGEYGGTGRRRRHQKMPGIQARKARGGEKDSVVVLVASIVPFLVMKGMALADRLKERALLYRDAFERVGAMLERVRRTGRNLYHSG